MCISCFCDFAGWSEMLDVATMDLSTALRLSILGKKKHAASFKITEWISHINSESYQKQTMLFPFISSQLSNIFTPNCLCCICFFSQCSAGGLVSAQGSMYPTSRFGDQQPKTPRKIAQWPSKQRKHRWALFWCLKTIDMFHFLEKYFVDDLMYWQAPSRPALRLERLCHYS